MKLTDVRTYAIQIHGRVEETDIQASSPLPFAIEPIEGENTSVTLLTDQSGIIGMIRHLHGLGLTLISICFTPETRQEPSEIDRKKGKEKS